MSKVNVALSRVLQKAARTGNPLVKRVLAGRAHPLMSRRLVLVSYTGRRTGRTYSTAVSYVRDGDVLLIPGGGRWWRNLGAGPVGVRLHGSAMSATPEVITELQAMSDLLSRMMAANPAFSVFTGIGQEPGGGPNPEDLDRERRRGFVIVRLHLDQEAKAARVA